MSLKPKIVFLYSELADYFVNAAKKLSQEAEVYVIRWPVNKEAPFQFNFDGLHVVQKDEINLSEFLSRIQPDAIVVSGWMDQEYVSAVKKFKKSIPIVLALDNHWTGNWKQRIWKMLAPFKLHNIYTHAWVPGEKQLKYAQKLGFKNILKSFYVANTKVFDDNYKMNQSLRNYDQKTILYVGRYVEHKGIFELWDAFAELSGDFPDWKLKCIGTGEEWDQRKKHDKIEHLGFMQPEELAKVVAEASFVVIPSKFEPWGVVVQEMAISGMPLIVTDCVGAAQTFVGKENGEIIATNDLNIQLQKVLQEIMQLDPNELREMGEKSHQKGMSLTPEYWVNEILSTLKS